MARRYGRCPRGQRLVSAVPWGHWKTTTFVAALRVDEIAAPCVFDGPMDGESFRAYVEQFEQRRLLEEFAAHLKSLVEIDRRSDR